MFWIKNKKIKRIIKKVLIFLCVLLGLFIFYTYIRIKPGLLFGHSLKYKNFIVYSRHDLDKNIFKVLDEAENNLSTSELSDTTLIHRIYLCDSYLLYKFFFPLIKKSYAENAPPHFYNIMIANSNIIKNEVYGKDLGDDFVFVRKLSSVIAHEVTHTLIDIKLIKTYFPKIEGWKIEGYCETVYYSDTLNISDAKGFLKKYKLSKTIPGGKYMKYYIAVAYLRLYKEMKFDDIMRLKLSLMEVLKEVENI
jgi:hypothetical protein